MTDNEDSLELLLSDIVDAIIQGVTLALTFLLEGNKIDCYLKHYYLFSR